MGDYINPLSNQSKNFAGKAGQEGGTGLAGVPVTSIIGGAFKAVVDSQAQANLTTIDFIKRAAFQKGDANNLGEPIMLEFSYTPPGQMMGMIDAGRKSTMKIPLLTVLPIPHLRISSLNINFSVKLTQTTQVDMSEAHSSTTLGSTSDSDSGDFEYENMSNENSRGYATGYKSNADWSTSSSFFGTVSTQQYNNHGMKVSREYSLKIEVEAVQDEIPGGMERMLDLLTNMISTTGGDEVGEALVNNMFSAGAAGSADSE